ncbi:hypothetical protein [Oceanotoga teriensis]|uniref:hypothetical protein n=1 Tax=Oceanotoga teriensis TaxID=515440 RepID=UPI002713B2A4|nr:hypothetical protein [Oceanotoga teriensis]MDO7976018.1 type II and III secretion system protein [Oceanotoga teriensis]
MKKILITILIFINSIFLSYNLDYNSQENYNTLNFKESEYDIFSNDIKTFVKIVFKNTSFLEKEYVINDGPVKKIKTYDNIIDIFFYAPLEKIEEYDSKIKFFGTKKINFEEFYFKSLKLIDFLEILFEKYEIKFINSTEIPDFKVSLNNNSYNLEYFLRLLYEVYGIDSRFYDDKTVIISYNKKNESEFLPLILNIVDEDDDFEIINIDNDEDLSGNSEIESNKESFVFNNYKILSSYSDIKFFEYIYDIKIFSFYDNYFLIYGNEKDLVIIEELVNKFNEKISYVDNNELKSEKSFNNLKTLNKIFVVNDKMKLLFDKIIIDKNIDYLPLEKYDNNYFYILSYGEEQKDFIEDLANQFYIKEQKEKYSLVNLINYVCENEGIKAICNFEDKDVFLSSKDLDLFELFSFLENNRILYNYIDEETIYFYSDIKLLKYSLYIFTGNNINNLNITDLYNIYNLNIFKNTDFYEDVFLVSKPIIYVNEGKESIINSVISIPIIDKKNEIVSKVESGFKFKVSGNYDRKTDMVTSKINITISEFENKDKNLIVDERNIETELKMNNNGIIKIGSMSFDKNIKKETGIPILKDIPIFGSIFKNYDNSYSKYEIIIITNIKVLNNPEAEDEG